MKLRNVIRGMFGAPMRRAFSVLDLTSYVPGTPAWSQLNYRTIATEGYIQNATVYACINEIATAMAGIPWKVMKKGKKPRPYDTHPLLDLLARPNPMQSGSEYTVAKMSYYLINGQVFDAMTGPPLDTEKPLTQPPKFLIMPRPDLVRPIPDKLGMIKAYEIGNQLDGTMKPDRWDATRVINWRNFNPIDPIFGLSPIKVAGKNVDTQNALVDFFYRLLKRNGRPEGVILVKSALDDEQYARLKETVDNTMNDAKNAGGYKLMEGEGIDVKEFSHKPIDMGLSPQETSQVLKICSVFKVPPEIIGITEAKTFSNYQEARKAFYLECVLPMMDALREKYTHTLVALYPDKPVLDYDKDQIEALQDDRLKMRELDQRDEDAGRITANEYRLKYGMPKADDELADQRMLGISRLPADDLAAQDVEDPLDPEDDEDLDEDKKDARTRARRNDPGLVMVRGLDASLTWRAFDDRRAGFIRSARRVFGTQLNADYVAAAQAIRAGQGSAYEAEAHVSNALQGRRNEWMKAYALVYNGVGLDFAEAVDKGLTDTFGVQRQRRAKQDTWEMRIGLYLEKEGGRKITEVNETTRRRIMNTARSGYEQGLGADAVAAMIEAAAPRATAGRGLLIARTEVIAASNLGSDSAARAFGVPLNKEWLATGDGRTREDHEAANGQTVGLDSSFEVGGSQLMFPGDSSLGAAADETIQCRCAVVYSVNE